MYYPQCGVTILQLLEFTNLKPIQSSSDEMKPKPGPKALRPTFTYSVRDGDEIVEYVIFDLIHGSDFGWQSYVELGAKRTSDGRSPEAIILKVYCRECTCLFREEEILKEIYKEGPIPGVFENFRRYGGMADCFGDSYRGP